MTKLKAPNIAEIMSFPMFNSVDLAAVYDKLHPFQKEIIEKAEIDNIKNYNITSETKYSHPDLKVYTSRKDNVLSFDYDQQVTVSAETILYFNNVTAAPSIDGVQLAEEIKKLAVGDVIEDCLSERIEIVYYLKLVRDEEKINDFPYNEYHQAVVLNKDGKREYTTNKNGNVVLTIPAVIKNDMKFSNQIQYDNYCTDRLSYEETKMLFENTNSSTKFSSLSIKERGYTKGMSDIYIDVFEDPSIKRFRRDLQLFATHAKFSICMKEKNNPSNYFVISYCGCTSFQDYVRFCFSIPSSEVKYVRKNMEYVVEVNENQGFFQIEIEPFTIKFFE